MARFNERLTAPLVALDVQHGRIHEDLHRGGVYNAHVSMSTAHEAIFEFTRTDATKCMVRLRCQEGGKGIYLLVYVLAEADMR